VDIDAAAVEVTKLSLLLKVLEGETGEIAQRDFLKERERILPDLANNIKCGNSLIGPDFYDQSEIDLLDDEARYRVNVFDWKTGFPEVFMQGGFDCVLGNPPYVRPHNMTDEDKKYFWLAYLTFRAKSDLYCCFIEQSTSLLKDNGIFSFIVSNGFLRLDSFHPLRKHFLLSGQIEQIVDFTGNVFSSAAVKTAIFVLRKGKINPAHEIEVKVCAPGADSLINEAIKIRQSDFSGTYMNIFDLSITDERDGFTTNFISGTFELGTVYGLSFGIKTGDDSKFLTFSKDSSPATKPLLRGENIHRYSHEFVSEYVDFRPDVMIAHRKTARPGTAQRYEQPKLLIRDTGGLLEAQYDAENYYVKDVIIVHAPANNIAAPSLHYLIGILNSKAMAFYYNVTFPTLHVQRGEVASLPIRPIDFTNPTDVEKHDRMVSLVDKMLTLVPKRRAEANPQAATQLDAQISATDRQIDRLVYELYGLTEEEIALVEGAK
jgi:hypothetical protein